MRALLDFKRCKAKYEQAIARDVLVRALLTVGYYQGRKGSSDEDMKRLADDALAAARWRSMWSKALTYAHHVEVWQAEVQ